MKIFIILGAPCAGKGTQCFLLNKILHHISAGELLRKKYPKGTKTRKLLDEGNLVSVDVMNNIIKNEIDHSQEMIIDGYPRDFQQAQFISQFPIYRVILLSVGKEIAYNRMKIREICEKCERTYAESTFCCMQTTKRLDDNEISFEKRFNIFQMDILKILTTLCTPVSFIDGEQSIEKVNQAIMKLI